MPAPIIPIAMGVTAVAGAILAANKSNKIKGAIGDIETAISDLEAKRSTPPDLNNFVQDTTSMIRNPYDNLGVATNAMKIKTQETDKALANTLDTLRASGKGAGGATALAMAAVQSKQAIGADIQKQEAENQRLKAAGEEKMLNLKRQEQIRMQQAGMENAKFMYTENRDEELRQLDRQQGLLEREWQQQAALESGVASAIGGTFSALGSLGGMG